MSIKWVAISPKEEGCLLGNVCIGGIVCIGKSYDGGPIFYQAECLLPGCVFSIKAFATLQEFKDSFEEAVSRWIESAGLK